MSKSKNKVNNVDTKNIEEVNDVKEATDYVPNVAKNVEEKKEEAPVETSVEPVVEEVPVKEETPVEENKVEPVSDEDLADDEFAQDIKINEAETGSKVEEAMKNPPASDNKKEADPLPEYDGSIYVVVANNPNDVEVGIINERLAKAGFNNSITSATGSVMVGPFKSNDEAITARKKIQGKGLRAEIREF
jgi:hypothetical protein